MRYKLAVVYNLAVPWLDPVEFGANVHRALEAIHVQALASCPPAEAELPTIVAQTWISGPRADLEVQAGAQRAAVNQLCRYLREHGGELSRLVRSETAFSCPVGDHVLLGRVDLVRFAQDDRLEIVDFKTSAALPIESEGIDLQLDLYALGIEHSLDQKVSRQTVHFLGDGRVDSWQWTPARQSVAQQRIAELLTQIEAEDFAPNRSYCHRCQEYRSICPYATTAKGED
jgi:ATP-dependent exoDNAse (exonuclease V) beta subunit